MVTKMADKIKTEKLTFWTKFKAFGDYVFKNYLSAQLNTKKSF